MISSGTLEILCLFAYSSLGNNFQRRLVELDVSKYYINFRLIYS